MALPEGIQGDCDPRFEEVPRVLADQLASGAHHGVAMAVYHRGESVVDVWGGRTGRDGDEEPWAKDTMAVSFSTTKGPAAVCLHMAMERAGIGYDTPVAEVWPEFAKNGKEAVTIRHVLCHEAGIPQIRDEVPAVTAMSDWDAMVEMIEGLSPLWPPGEQNGYHAINFGWLVGELVRRIDGRHIRDFLQDEVAKPLDLDGCYMGTPPDQHHRAAPLISTFEGGEQAVMQQFLPPESLTLRALSPEGDIVEFLNSPQGLLCVGPAFSGTFTARSLAKVYAALERGGELGGVRLLDGETVAKATEVQNDRPDLVIFFPIRWRLGFMSGGGDFSPAGPNPNAYGHAGFGGSVGLVDPDAELAIGIVLDRLEIDLLGGDRIRRAVHAAIDAVRAN